MLTEMVEVTWFTSQVRLQLRGFTFCLDAREVRPAQVCGAPVLQEDAAIEPVLEDVEWVAQLPKVRDDIRQEVAALAVDAARPPDSLGLRAWSPADAMRDGLRLLHGPVETKSSSANASLNLNR